MWHEYHEYACMVRIPLSKTWCICYSVTEYHMILLCTLNPSVKCLWFLNKSLCVFMPKSTQTHACDSFWVFRILWTFTHFIFNMTFPKNVYQLISHTMRIDKKFNYSYFTLHLWHLALEMNRKKKLSTNNFIKETIVEDIDYFNYSHHGTSTTQISFRKTLVGEEYPDNIIWILNCLIWKLLQKFKTYYL